MSVFVWDWPINFIWLNESGRTYCAAIHIMYRQRADIVAYNRKRDSEPKYQWCNKWIHIHDDELLYMSDMKRGQCWHKAPLIHCLALFSLSPLPCNSAAPRANLTVTVTISRLATLLDKMMSYILPQWFLFLKKSIVCSLSFGFNTIIIVILWIPGSASAAGPEDSISTKDLDGRRRTEDDTKR